MTLQSEHLVHLLDGMNLMQKWQWHGKYVTLHLSTLANYFQLIVAGLFFIGHGFYFTWCCNDPCVQPLVITHGFFNRMVE